MFWQRMIILTKGYFHHNKSLKMVTNGIDEYNRSNEILRPAKLELVESVSVR